MTLGFSMKNKKYKYKGKIIECEERIIRQLNLALAMNRSEDRYVEVKPKKKNGSKE